MCPEKQTAYREPPFPFEGELQENFESALEAATLRTLESVDSLRRAVCDCVDELKSKGMPPEGVILTLRAYLRYSAKDHFPIPPGTDWELDSLSQKLAEWCVDAYYKDAAE